MPGRRRRRNHRARPAAGRPSTRKKNQARHGHIRERARRGYHPPNVPAHTQRGRGRVGRPAPPATAPAPGTRPQGTRHTPQPPQPQAQAPRARASAHVIPTPPPTGPPESRVKRLRLRPQTTQTTLHSAVLCPALRSLPLGTRTRTPHATHIVVVGGSCTAQAAGGADSAYTASHASTNSIGATAHGARARRDGGALSSSPPHVGSMFRRLCRLGSHQAEGTRGSAHTAAGTAVNSRHFVAACAARWPSHFL